MLETAYTVNFHNVIILYGCWIIPKPNAGMQRWLIYPLKEDVLLGGSVAAAFVYQWIGLNKGVGLPREFIDLVGGDFWVMADENSQKYIIV